MEDQLQGREKEMDSLLPLRGTTHSSFPPKNGERGFFSFFSSPGRKREKVGKGKRCERDTDKGKREGSRKWRNWELGRRGRRRAR